MDGDSLRIARRYFASGDQVRLEPEAPGSVFDALVLPAENMIVMGVIIARLRISPTGDQVIEEPLG